jgi:hypothetical protein
LRFLFSQGSRSASLVVPTETIFPPRQSTAPFSMMASCLRSGPRCGPGLPGADCNVRSWPMLIRKTDDALCTRPLCTEQPPRRRGGTDAFQCHRTRRMIPRWRQKPRRTPCLRVSVVRIHCASIGTLTPAFRANSFASSYPASTWRITPIPGSVVKTRSIRFAISSVPSATVTCPACRE